MPYWSNRAAIKDLTRFRNQVIEYYKNAKVSGLYDEEIDENGAAQRARMQINRLSTRVAQWAAAAGHDGDIRYTEPAVVGGRSYPLNLLANVFQLRNLRLQPQQVTDVVEKAIGVYTDDATASLIRTLNPFFWLARLFESVASIPFALLGKLGLDKEKAEASALGRLVKASLFGLQALAAFLGVLEKLNLLSRLRTLVGLP